MRFLLDGREEWLPADWTLNLDRVGARFSVTVERDGTFMTLTAALTRRDLETTSSKSHNKVTVFPGGRT